MAGPAAARLQAAAALTLRPRVSYGVMEAAPAICFHCVSCQSRAAAQAQARLSGALKQAAADSTVNERPQVGPK